MADRHSGAVFEFGVSHALYEGSVCLPVFEPGGEGAGWAWD